MARIRSVKPELRTSEVVASWPREVRYAFVLLWGYLDDKGRGLDVPKTIAGDLFPHDDDVTPAKMGKWLNLMATTKLDPDKEPPVCRYEVAGRRYLHTVNVDEHQRPNRPTPSRLPPCPVHEGLSEPLTEPSSVDDGEGIDARNGKNGRGTVTKPTTGGSNGGKRGHGKVSDAKTNAGSPKDGSGVGPLPMEPTGSSESSGQARDAPLSESLTTPSLTGIRSSGAGELGIRSSSGAGEPRSEPLGERLSAAAEIIAEKTDATPSEAEQLAAAIDRDRKPRNLPGLVNALAKGPDLATRLTEMRDQAGRGDTAAGIAKLRRGPECPHGEPGGAALHPTSRQPLCALCRKAARDD